MQANFAHCYTTQGKNISSSARIQLLITRTLDENSWGDLGSATTPIPKEMDWSKTISNRKLMPTRAEARISDEIRAAHDELFGGTDVDDVMNPASWDFIQSA